MLHIKLDVLHECEYSMFDTLLIRAHFSQFIGNPTTMYAIVYLHFMFIS